VQSGNLRAEREYIYGLFAQTKIFDQQFEAILGLPLRNSIKTYGKTYQFGLYLIVFYILFKSLSTRKPEVWKKKLRILIYAGYQACIKGRHGGTLPAFKEL
jgi:hypothetical protein